MKHLPDHAHYWLDRISWGLAILLTAFCAVKLYESLPNMDMPMRVLILLIPSALISFVSAVILKAVFMWLYILADRMAQKDFDDYHKKD